MEVILSQSAFVQAAKGRDRVEAPHLDGSGTTPLVVLSVVLADRVIGPMSTPSEFNITSFYSVADIGIVGLASMSISSGLRIWECKELWLSGQVCASPTKLLSLITVSSGYSLDGDALSAGSLPPYIQQAVDQVRFVECSDGQA